jgi:hypothetical protein
VRHRALGPLSSTMFLRGELCMRCDVFSAERPTLAHAWWDKLTHVHCAALLVAQVSQQGEFLTLQAMLPYAGRVSLSAQRQVPAEHSAGSRRAASSVLGCTAL